MATFSEEIRNRLTYNMDQLLEGAWLKSVIATAGVFFVEVLYGDLIVLNIYLLFLFLDLILGVVKSKVYGTYRVKEIGRWVGKLLTHLLVILLFGLVCNSLFTTSGFLIPTVNWLLFCLTITELASILDNLRKLGAPVPPIVYKFLKILRRQAAKKLSTYVEDPEMKEDLLRTLSEERRADQGRRGDT